MNKDSDIKIVCRQCGKEFVFTTAEQEFYKQRDFSLPRRCRECRSGQREEAERLLCSQCGVELEKGAVMYCENCLANVRLESEMKITKLQGELDAACDKLETEHNEKVELEESLGQKEKLVLELEQKVVSLSDELKELRQLYETLNRWFQPALSDVEGRVVQRLETIEHGQNKINERLYKAFQKMLEIYENITLWEVIKRSLRRSQVHTTEPTRGHVVD